MGMILIPIILTIFVVIGIITLSSNIPVFSKAIFAVVAAIVVHNNNPFDIGGFISFVIWLAIISVGCLILCLAPRVNRSFLFICNTFITHIASGMVVSIFCSLFMYDQKPELYVEIISKTICLLGSIVALGGQIESTKRREGISIRVLAIIERVIASFVYALAVLFLVGISFNNYYKLSLTIGILIFGVSFVIAYIFDDVLLEGMSRKVGVQNVSYEVEEEDKSIWSRINARFEYQQDIEEYVSAKVFEKEQKEEEDRWHREWMERDDNY